MVACLFLTLYSVPFAFISLTIGIVMVEVIVILDRSFARTDHYTDPPEELEETIEQLSNVIDVPTPEVYVLDDNTSSEISGFGEAVKPLYDNAYVGIEPSGIDAIDYTILIHELAHIKQSRRSYIPQFGFILSPLLIFVIAINFNFTLSIILAVVLLIASYTGFSLLTYYFRRQDELEAIHIASKVIDEDSADDYIRLQKSILPDDPSFKEIILSEYPSRQCVQDAIEPGVKPLPESLPPLPFEK